MKKSHRILIGCGATGLLVAGGALLVSGLMRPEPPEPQAGAPEQTVEYLASEKFVKADQEDKERYIRQIRVPDSNPPLLTLLFHPGVAQEQRRKVMENILPVVAPVINQRLDEFERLAPAEQTARLDAIIDRMQEARGDNPGMMSSLERLNLILQYLDPHTRARLRRHLPAVRARMKERKIPAALPF